MALVDYVSDGESVEYFRGRRSGREDVTPSLHAVEVTLSTVAISQPARHPRVRAYEEVLGAYEEVLGAFGRIDEKARMRHSDRSMTRTDWVVCGLPVVSFAMAFLALLTVAALLTRQLYGYVIPAGFALLGFVLMGAVTLSFLRAKATRDKRR